jgi:mono/diheme cytochrome c family protein
MTRLFFHQARRALIPAVLLLVCLSGCENRYPDSLHYPLRTDLIFLEKPTGEHAEPFYPVVPGHLDENIQLIKQHGGKTVNPARLPSTDRPVLESALEDAFGTPAWPEVWHFGNEKNKQAIAKLRLDHETLEAGSDLYRRHCLHCHGLTGNGRGPTGPWLSPSPRDYRQGEFKFISTALDLPVRKARRADLRRTLDVGVEGTSMPSFNMLSKEEREQLVSYIIHLSIRGETELLILKTLLAEKGKEESAEDVQKTLEENRKALARSVKGKVDSLYADAVRYYVTDLLANWVKSDKINEPSPYPYDDDDKKAREASISRGYQFFIGAGACAKCHADFGRQPPFRYDHWGTLVRPANLTAGVYRGGRRPVDLYWRVTGGIPPSDMPAAPDSLKSKGPNHPTDDRWDLVNFVRYLPYPHMLPDDVRAKIYDQAKKEPAPEHAEAGGK